MILFVLAKQIVIIELYRNHHTNWNISTARASEQGKCNQKNKGESRVSRTGTEYRIGASEYRINLFFRRANVRCFTLVVAIVVCTTEN